MSLPVFLILFVVTIVVATIYIGGIGAVVVFLLGAAILAVLINGWTIR